MIAFLEAKRAGLLKRSTLVSNLIAGLVVAVVALPLSMAFAIASGARPEQGLYTAIIAGFLTSIFGGCRMQIAGPTGAFIVILASITAKYGMDGLQIATLMAGVLLFLMGLVRLGSAIKYIPAPVTVGFTSAIAVIIFVGQWKNFFGLNTETHGHYFHQEVWELVQALPSFNQTTTLLAITTLTIMLLSSRFLKRIPAPLIALCFATFLQAYFHFDGVATIGSAFGKIPAGLPAFHWPSLSLNRVIELFAPAFTIAMLGSIESLLSAVVADGMTGTRHQSNQELIGQGISNMVSPLFGGFASTGAIARTATNIRSGGTNPLAGIFHALILLVILLSLSPYAVYVPLYALAVILFVVSYNMSEVHRFVGIIKHAPQADIIILLTTFLLTLFVNLVIAVNIGVVLASLFFMRKMAHSIKIDVIKQHDHDYPLQKPLPKNVIIYSVEGPLFFGAAETFAHTLLSTNAEVDTIIIRLHDVPFIDATGLDAFDEMLSQLLKRKVKIILCEMNELLVKKLKKAEILEKVGEEHIYPTLAKALAKTHLSHTS